MKEQSRPANGALRRALHLAAATLAIAGLGAVSGCLTRPIAPIEPLTTSTVVEKLTKSGVDKIDLVLVVDNSQSMADKQAILALAIPDLIVGLVNPACLDNTTNLPVSAATQPADPISACPANSTREFTPVLDIHIGLLSSSPPRRRQSCPPRARSSSAPRPWPAPRGGSGCRRPPAACPPRRGRRGCADRPRGS